MWQHCHVSFAVGNPDFWHPLYKNSLGKIFVLKELPTTERVVLFGHSLLAYSSKLISISFLSFIELVHMNL